MAALRKTTLFSGAVLTSALAILAASISPPAASAQDRAAQAAPRKVDFSYAFVPPHRLTIGRPDDSRRTLLDLQPGSLRLAWSYQDLTGFPVGALMIPTANWDIRVTPQPDGQAFGRSHWQRRRGYLPALVNTYEDTRGVVRLEAIGAEEAALVRIAIENTDTTAHRFVLRCDSNYWGENRAWVDPARWTGDFLLAGWLERADRLLLLGLGADRLSLSADGRPPGARTMVLVWDVPAGEKRSGWLIRPYEAYLSDLDALRARDWNGRFQAAEAEWQALLDRASRPAIPDPAVADAFLASLADLFIMREPVAGGYLAGVPGTEIYRAANSCEASVVAVALDQVGLHDLSAKGHRLCLEMQEPDGEWNDPKGWGHLVWCGAGFKAWAAMEHYRLTRDRDYLVEVYPRLAASARWREGQRARTRIGSGPERPLTFGLMPRGFGDCGLADGDDNYGVFLPHNIWAVYADKLAVEAAEGLDRKDDFDVLKQIFDASRTDLLAALDRGAIREDGYRWIPGAPGKTTGSRWGVLNALFPSGLLPPGQELITGTLRYIESRMSPGGLPLHTGCMADGMWVAIALDNVAEAHLARGEGDAAAAYLYAALNHGKPLLTWCEERGQEPGTTKCSGDRQHLWTPVAVVRLLRDMYVMEGPEGLHLGLGTAREWLGGGKPVGFADAPTHFGRVSYEMRFDESKKAVSGEVRIDDNPHPPAVFIHARLPEGRRILSCDSTPRTALGTDGETIVWKAAHGTLTFTAKTS